MGKMIGGGLPVAVVAGKSELLEESISASNTHAQNPMVMASGIAALSLSTPEVFDRLRGQGRLLRAGLRQIVAGLNRSYVSCDEQTPC